MNELTHEFFINDRLAEIEPLGRILLLGLREIGNEKGVLEDRPKWIKVTVLPYDRCNVEKLLQQLEDQHFIKRIVRHKKYYIQVNWPQDFDQSILFKSFAVKGRKSQYKKQALKTNDVIRYFKSVPKLAKALGITRHAVYQWGEDVPESRAYQIEVLTNSLLKAKGTRVAVKESKR